jgi:hypothetical protein
MAAIPALFLKEICSRKIAGSGSTMIPKSPTAFAMLARSDVAKGILQTCPFSRSQKSDIGLH